MKKSKVLNWSESSSEERNKIYDSIVISKKQARAIALAIIDDIEPYIKEHQAEYEEFLREENNK